MPVDSFKYVSRLVTRYYKLTSVKDHGLIPWAPLSKPLEQSTFTLVTSGRLYDRSVDEPFDMTREEREPSWGDPSYRTLPVHMAPGEMGASHASHPEIPPPIMGQMGKHIGHFLRNLSRSEG